MKIISYARYSTDKQTEASIQDQQRVCREYAEEHGWAITAECTDQGISGAAFGNRPGVRAALDALGAGDILLVADLSRLSRSQELAPLMDRLRYRGAKVLGVLDGFDSDSPTARMQAGLSGIMSDEMRASIRIRTHSALTMRAKLGRATGGKAYDNRAIVEEIFRRFADGEPMLAIASDLNRRQIPSPGAHWKPRYAPTRGKWMVAALHAILHNERYIGRLVWNRSQWVKNPDTGRRIRRERPQSQWIVQDCERWVDDDTWRRVQARFSTKRPGGGAPRYLLSGILTCGVCGSKLIVVGGTQRRYLCGTRHHGGPHACPNSTTFPREAAEQRILQPIMAELLSAEAVEAGVRALREARKAAEGPPPPQSEEVLALERLVREGTLSREIAAPAIAAARRKTERPPVADLPWPTPAAWRAAVQNMRDVLLGDDVGAAREVLRRIVGDVACEPAQDHVVASFGPSQEVVATGTGPVYGVKSHPRYQVHIPISTSKKRSRT